MSWARRFFADCRLGTRALLRDLKSGELRILLLALMVGITAVATVGFLVERVDAVLARSSAEMLGGDLVLKSDEPPKDAIRRQAHAQGLSVAETLEFPSMVGSDQQVHLASVKAVEENYPLRGELGTTAQMDGRNARLPQPGEVWVDPQILGLLGISVGDTLQLGERRMMVAAELTYEPDRGLRFINVAPRLLMRAEDLEQTGLLGPGSRVRHRLLLAGPAAQVEAFRKWLEPRLERGQALSEPEESQSEMQGSVAKAPSFLRLIALLTVTMAAVALALSAREFARQRADGVAVMRCLGASRRQLRRLLAAEFLGLAALGGLAGIVLGYGLQAALGAVLGSWFDLILPPASWRPAFHAGVSALLFVGGFIVPPLVALSRVPPSRVFRRSGLLAHQRWAVLSLAGLAAYLALAAWVMRSIPDGLIAGGGFLAAAGVFVLVAYGLVFVLGRLRHLRGLGPRVRFALAGLARRPVLATTQICGLASGLMLLLVLSILHTDLLAQWSRSLPSDTPNTFVINIQPDQQQLLAARLAARQPGEVTLYPMVRGRLVAINERAVHREDYTEDRARRTVDREFNLSWSQDLPSGNTLIDGRWFQGGGDEISLESGLADRLGIRVGDTVSFDVAGRIIRVKVSSLRRVNWDSFQANFFALLSPGTLEKAPTTYITSLYVPGGSAAITADLVREFPNVTVLDVGLMLSQLRHVLAQAVQAVQMLFLVSLCAGVLVLMAAFLSTRGERMSEAALMRALGASRMQLHGALRFELFLIGSVAGLLAAGGAHLISSLLASHVFQIDLVPSVWPWAAGMAAGALASLLAGGLMLRRVLRTSPLLILREAA